VTVRAGRILAVATLLLAAALPANTLAQAEREFGALLPLQDRTGNRRIAERVQQAIRAQLASVYRLADPVEVRNAMRRLRIRNARDTDPSKLRQLGEELEIDWVFTATLHRTAGGAVPMVTISAQSFRTDTIEIDWAGFEATSGLDNRRLLDRGVIRSLEILAERTAFRLAGDFLFGGASSRADAKAYFKPARNGFLRRPTSPEELGAVAIVPFDSITDREGAINAEIVTNLAFATLFRNGVRVVRPSLVNEVLRRQGALYLGEMDALARLALRIAARADRIVTGTVEIYDRQGGREPEPWVSFFARLIDVETGRILWINGLENTGWDNQQAFLTNRLYSAGRLAEEMMHSLIAGLLAPGDEPPAAEG
jgi:hypothetical protein